MEEEKTIRMAGERLDIQTLQCNVSTAVSSALQTAVRTRKNDGESDLIEADSSCFVIKGRPYHRIRNLSSGSGEAQVFLVRSSEEELYVLKLYYPKYSPQEELLKIIWNMDFEMIVQLKDYGVIMIDGAQRSYELMEYLQGGTLSEYRLNGDEEQFRRIALSAAAALAYCHANRILHKDIKPGNFFFRDTAHTSLVLGDFGISSLWTTEGTMRTTQARTPVFASPEMYVDVIDGEVELTPGSDYYSLGLTLLCVWLGRNPFPKDEREMMRMKNEGRIPELNTLPPAVRQIIRGLTAAHPDRRWTLDEVERWFRGEEVPVDESSYYLRYKSFVVDPEQNLVAADVKELVALLYDKRVLGIRYLYSKRISRWLEECGNSKLSVILDDIVERRFPVDQELGLTAAIYALDAEFPYYDVKGRPCRTVPEITLAVLNHSDEYVRLLQNPDDQLYIWLEMHEEIDRIRLSRYFKGQDGRRAVAMFLYEIDVTLPFLDEIPSSTVEEIVWAFGHGPCSEDQWESLTDGRLLAWMNVHESKVLCEAVRLLTEGKTYSENLAWQVLYTIDRQCAFDLREARTAEAVAQLLNRVLQINQSSDIATFTDALSDFISPEGKLHFYAAMRGWTDVLEWQNRYMDVKSPEVRKRLGFYDVRVAAYKLCAAMGVDPVYEIREGDEVVCEICQVEDLEQVDRTIVCRALRKGSLREWLAVKYHENPFAVFEKEYDYEYALQEFLDKVGAYNPGDPYYKRFVDAKEQTVKRYEDTEHLWYKARWKERVLITGFTALSGLLATLILILGIPDRNLFMDYVWYAVWIPLAFCSFLIFTFRGHHFVNYGIAFALMMGVGGVLLAAVPVYALKWCYAVAPDWITVLLAVFVGLYWLAAMLLGCKSSTRQLQDFEGAFENKDEISTRLLEPLYYTFKTRSYKYRGSKFGLLDDIAAEVKFTEKDVFVHYVSWIMLMIVMTGVFIWFHPALMGHKVPGKDHWKEQVHEVIDQIKDVK